jgi:exodeoxyribonuclease VII large subunit
VRAAAGSAIPLISAVGHETDWTLIDHAADRRAPTPTGAAEMAVPVRADLEAGVASLGARLRTCTSRHQDQRRQSLRQMARALPSIDMLLALPRRRFDEAAGKLGRALELNTLNKRRAYEARAMRLTPATLEARLKERRQSISDLSIKAERIVERRVDRAEAALRAAASRLSLRPAEIRIERALEGLDARMQRADRAFERLVERRRGQFGEQIRMLASLDYKNVLKRGYAIVRDEAARPIPLAAELQAGTRVSLQFADGSVEAMTGGEAAPPRQKQKPTSPPPRKAEQGSLF